MDVNREEILTDRKKIENGKTFTAGWHSTLPSRSAARAARRLKECDFQLDLEKARDEQQFAEVDLEFVRDIAS